VDESTKTDYVEVQIYKPKEKKDKVVMSTSSMSLNGAGGGVCDNNNSSNYNSSKDSEYKYRFQVPDSKTYDLSTSNMHQKNVESIKWNDIDRYICIQVTF
jgi:hypothetical protein